MTSAPPASRPDRGGKAFYLFVGNRVAVAALVPMVLAGLLLSYFFIERAKRDYSTDLQRAVDQAASRLNRSLSAQAELTRSLAQQLADREAADPPPDIELPLSRDAWQAIYRGGDGAVLWRWPVPVDPALAVPPSGAGSGDEPTELRLGSGGEGYLGTRAPVGAGGGVVTVWMPLHPREMLAGGTNRFALQLGDAHGHRFALTAGGELASAGLADDASLLSAEQVLSGGVRVLARGRVDSVAPQEWGEYAIAASLLLFAALISWTVAQGVAHQVTLPLNRLAQDLSGLDLERNHQDLALPKQAPREILALFGEFNALLQRLRGSYTELQASLEESQLLRQRMERLIEERDEIIRNRTADLQSRTQQLERANAALERVASEDGLTGTANRRAFDEFLALVWRLAVREQVSVALILLDVDCFKSFNDRYGHPAGDECLRQVAQAIKAFAKRPLDIVARYGGEEFAIVLGRCRLEEAVEIAETMRCAIESLRIPNEAGGIGDVVTASLGVAASVPGTYSQSSDLVSAADACLYRAKNQGRNRVVG